MTTPTRPLLAALASCLLLMTGSASAMSSVSGPDVSSYQHPSGQTISWGSAKASGSATFGFVKASEGPGYTNPYFASDFAGMAAAGMIRGAYHFASPSTSAAAQAQHFVDVTGTLHQKGDLPPVLDLETSGGLSPTALIAWTQSYLQTIKTLTGRNAIIYTGPYFWQTAMANSGAFSGYPLWIATYGPAPQIPGGWSTYTFWQYTSSATLPGVTGAVDMSVFNGTLASLQALANGVTSAAPTPPVGSLDAATWNGSAVVAAGWTIDPATANPINVAVSVDGGAATVALANTSRPDVAYYYPRYGASHGYAVAVPATAGAHSVCVTALGIGGTTTKFTCRTVTVPVAKPIGAFDAVTWNGTAVNVSGWAIDPVMASPTNVSVSVDGGAATVALANTSRPDVAHYYPMYGPSHGYSVAVPAAAGPHSVCVTAVTAAASRTSFGCRNITVPASKPFGAFDAVTWNGSAMVAAGWAVDPNSTAPIPVSVSVDGATPRTGTASTVRADVARVFPAYGTNHGYAVTVPATPGPHSVCVTAVNVGAGTVDTPLGCRTFTVPTASPFGHLDTVSWNGSALVARGWAIDPNTSAPISVAVSVDGATRTRTANVLRSDVGGVYPASGPNHGFSVAVRSTRGTHSMCVTALNTGAGTLDTPLGCRTVTVP